MSDTDSTFGNNTLQRVNIKNVLSFGEKGLGEDGNGLELKPLNVLIGPNGSGKSNFLNCLAALQAGRLPYPLYHLYFFSRMGSIQSWLRKGNNNGSEIEISAELRIQGDKVNNHLKFDNPVLKKDYMEWKWDWQDSKLIFEQRPDLTQLYTYWNYVTFYGSFVFNSQSEIRIFQNSSQQDKWLDPEFKNAWSVLRKLFLDSPTLVKVFEDLLSDFLGMRYTISTDIVQKDFIFLKVENEKETLQVSRMSDGTLRFICLLILLLHPTPPPLICLEEPELGMHPDIIPVIAKLLAQASTRTQLIVTTHSDMLLDCLSDDPECIVVCERTEDGTSMKRVQYSHVERLLENYSMGQLWMKGALGGTRW